MFGRSDMRDKIRDHIEDIAVIGGLAVFALWTYLFLPVAFFHT
jgi:hypothetical protein